MTFFVKGAYHERVHTEPHSASAEGIICPLVADSIVAAPSVAVFDGWEFSQTERTSGAKAPFSCRFSRR